MSNEAVGNDSPSLRIGRTLSSHWRPFSGRRGIRVAFELGYDAFSWICGLLAAAWMTRDLTGTAITPFVLIRAAGAICLLSAAAGLLAGLYRGRYQRGSLDEVMGVGLATCVMALFLALISPQLISGQQAALQAVTGSAMFALLAMLGARYVLFAVRQRVRRSATATVNVIVFGAGDAGSTLIYRLKREPHSTYRPVAILDDDPAKRRLRIQGIQVLGDRTRMAEVAAMTGATVLVIAIARASGTAIRDLTAQAESCGLDPEGRPVGHRTARRERPDRGRARPPDQRPARPQAGADRRGRGGRALRGQAHPGHRGRRLDRRGALPATAPLRASRADHAGPGRIRAARDPAGPARTGPAGLGRDDPGRHPRSAPGQGGLRAVPAADRVPRRGTQASSAAGALPGRGGQEQRARHPERAGGRGGLRGRVVRQHLDRQGRGPGQRARLLQAGRRTAHRPYGRPGVRQLPERPVRQRPGQPRLGADRPVRPGRSEAARSP